MCPVCSRELRHSAVLHCDKKRVSATADVLAKADLATRPCAAQASGKPYPMQRPSTQTGISQKLYPPFRLSTLRPGEGTGHEQSSAGLRRH